MDYFAIFEHDEALIMEERNRILSALEKIEHGSPERYWITMEDVKKIVKGVDNP